MSGTGPRSLGDRLRSRIREDRELMDRAIESELKNFEESFRRRSNAALRTIESDINSRIRPLAQSLRRAWLIPLTVGLSLSLGILGGSWGMALYLSSNLQDLARSVREQRLTLSALQDGTAGITLHRKGREAFLTLHEGWSLESGRTTGGAPAWKLSRD